VRIVWSEGAEANLQDIFQRIAQDNVTAAFEMEERIRGSVRRLRDMPRSGRIGGLPGTYELVIPRSPYIAVYRISEDAIGIVRLLHGRQLWPPAQ
jgi:addiction module RelE/StbE family toxin